MRRLILLLIVPAMIAAAACGGGDAKPSPTRESTTPPAGSAATATSAGSDSGDAGDDAAKAAAKAAVLTSADFPTTWTSTPASGNSDAQPGEQDEFDKALEQCSGISENDDFAGTRAQADSDEFTGPAEQSVSSDATVFDNAGHATDALDAIAGAFDKCHQAFIDLAQGTFDQSISDSGLDPSAIDLQVNFDKHDWADLGDDARGYRLTLDVGQFDVHLVLDFVFIRQGRIGGTLFYQASDEDADSRSSTAQTVARKLGEADKGLR